MKTINEGFLMNPIYVEKLLPNRNRFFVLGGGAGSGKSFAAAQKFLLRLKSEPDSRFLVCRKVAADLRHSVWQLFKDIISLYDLGNEFIVSKTEMRITHTSGNEILFMGLDDPERVKSIQGITSMLIEEATELDEEDLTQLNLRMRGKCSSYFQIVLCFNPIDEGHWIKKMFFDMEFPDAETLITTFRHNKFLDENYKAQLENLILHDKRAYQVYCLGEWGIPDNTSNFYKNFDQSSTVANTEYIPNLPILLSFDFNVNPYVSCLVAQKQGDTLFIHSEIALSPPKNRITDTCKEFVNRYAFHKGGIMVFGDASGQSDDTKNEKGYNCFSLITNELTKHNPQLKVPKSNPSVLMRGLYIDKIFAGAAKEKLVINPGCKKLTEDLTYVKMDADGTKLKKVVKDKTTGVSYQQYGHMSDTLEYLIIGVMNEGFLNFQRGGSKTVGIKVGKQDWSKNKHFF